MGQPNHKSSDLEAKFNDEMSAFMNGTLFPTHNVPGDIHVLKNIGLYHNSPKSLNVSVDFYIALRGKSDVEYTLQEMYTVIRSLEDITEKEYCDYVFRDRDYTLNQGFYPEFLKTLEAMTAEFNAPVSEKTKSLRVKYQAMNRLQMNGAQINGKHIQLGKQ